MPPGAGLSGMVGRPPVAGGFGGTPGALGGGGTEGAPGGIGAPGGRGGAGGIKGLDAAGRGARRRNTGEFCGFLLWRNTRRRKRLAGKINSDGLPLHRLLLLLRRERDADGFGFGRVIGFRGGGRNFVGHREVSSGALSHCVFCVSTFIPPSGPLRVAFAVFRACFRSKLRYRGRVANRIEHSTFPLAGLFPLRLRCGNETPCHRRCRFHRIALC